MISVIERNVNPAGVVSEKEENEPEERGQVLVGVDSRSRGEFWNAAP